MEEVNFDKKYNKWDEFVADMMYALLCAQSKVQFFVLTELDSKETYDLLFYAIAQRANQFVGCQLLCYPSNLFKFWLFKRKEHSAKYLTFKARKAFHTTRLYVSDREDRVELIEQIAEKHQINPEDLASLYKEYYSK